ncbi:PhzF family phenazine biosynthesis protein [Thermoleptolyngbya oregonensis NK1-22]|uniref:PhzF family phenazine biosynthesis protein n=1 Tax=Thermoleptolyngbya oregonensis NK1-22 TaxID=2547457 RepID=A0AA96Y2R7_9CYAN|nr:PhzF family phenazine biosynthesis protein [Thermoleptolyngbya oregonensis]WOB42615.1 PhzF family phenazine biosynthesis protein [Thermoleptolyngbya oregonensis NK1-22]
MGFSIIQVDAFTAAPFAGNPAAVCVLASPQPDEWMQAVAREMNLSETAFLLPEADGYRLRWFTPAVEVTLCGHATLASAHVLWREGYLPAGAIARFHTLSGLLTATQQGDWIELDFPAKRCAPIDPPTDLLEALGLELGTGAIAVSKNQFDYLVEVASPEIVRQLGPDFTRLRTLPVRGVIVTSRAEVDSEYDFISRFFAPGSGVDEDPVTGSAHCALAPYWGDRLSKDAFLAYQASARGGVVKARLAGDRVFLGGQAVTVLRGELI